MRNIWSPIRSLILVLLISAVLVSPGMDVSGQKPPDLAASGGLIIQNIGQFQGAGEFVAQGSAGSVWFAGDGIWVSRFEMVPLSPGMAAAAARQRAAGGETVKIWFEGVNSDAFLEPVNRLQTRVSYLIGSNPTDWFTDVPAYNSLVYRNIYPGIDLEFSAESISTLDWSFRAEDGADISQIKMIVSGAADVLQDEGGFLVRTLNGEIRLPLPILESDDGLEYFERSVEPALVTQMGTDFQIASPFQSPAVQSGSVSGLLGGEDLLFSTLIGGSGQDSIYGAAVNDDQEAYVIGDANSIDFPVTPGAFDPSIINQDAFIARFNNAGTGLIYATFLGGSSIDTGTAIAVENDIAYVAGDTYSHDFPLTNLLDDDSDAYLAAITPDGSDLVYAVLHGGSEVEYGNGVDVEAGYAYLIGSTYSNDIPGGTSSKLKGFAAKFSSSGNRVYAVTFGGRNDDGAYAVDVSGGLAYISGYSASRLWGIGSVGAGDGYFVKLSPVGEPLLIRKFGGTADDYATQIAVDDNKVILGGHTSSTDVAVTEGAYGGGITDGFVSRYNLETDTWDYAAYLGGSSSDSVFGMVVDPGGGIQITGTTSSTDFPVTLDAYQSSLAGGTDAFVVRYDLAGSDPGHRSYASFLGGTATDTARAIEVDLYGYSYIAGTTTSSDFPTTPGAYDTLLAGSQDGYLAKMSIGPIPSIVIEKHTNTADADLAPGPTILYGGMVNWTYLILNTGPVTLSQVAVDDNDPLVVPICPKSSLAVGESMTCTATGTAIAGQYSNIGSVQAVPPVGPMVSDSDPSHYFGALPSISIVKKTNGVDSTQPGQDILVGSTVNWTYEVTNSGNVSLGSVMVSDSDETLTVVCPKTTLAAEEMMTCNAQGIAVGGNYSNTATVTATPPDSLPSVSDSESDYYHGVGPDIMITKDISLDGGTSWLLADAAPSPKLLSGYNPNYRITVTNNGDTNLSNIMVTDADLDLSTCTFSTSLVKDAVTSCIISIPWTPGQNDNAASVSASYTDTFGNTQQVSDSNSASYFGVQTGLTILKEISLDNGVTWLDADTPGDLTLLSTGFAPKYRITLQNTGNVPLDVALNDPTVSLPGICKSGILQPDDLTPGGSDQRVCETTAAWAAGTRTNTATATSSFSDDAGHASPITITESASYFGASPMLSMELEVSINGGTTWIPADSAPGPSLLSGTNPQYRLTLTNSGNVRIENILVNDDELPLAGCDVPISLNAGAQTSCTVTKTWSSGQHHYSVSSAASFTDSSGNLWTSNLADDVNYFGAAPGLNLSKDVSVDGGGNWLPADSAPGPYLLNGIVAPQYRLTLTNSGNVDLPATISDPALTLPPECSTGVIAAGLSRQCTVTGVWAPGSRLNTAQASSTYTDTAGTQRIVSSDNSAYYFGAIPQIDLEEFVSGDGGATWQDADSTPGPYLLSGSNLQFKLVLDNTGNVDVSTLAWNDPGLNLTSCSLPGSLTPSAEPVVCIVTGTWASGQVSFTASASAAYLDTAGHTASPADSDQTHYFGAAPGVSITKNTNGLDANTEPGPYILVGDQVTWTYEITNTGNVPLTAINVSDDNGTPAITSDDFDAVCDQSILPVAGSQVCSKTGIAVAGQYGNTGTVSTQPKIGEFPVGLPLEHQDTSHYFGAQVSLTLEKFVSLDGNIWLDANDAPGPFIEAGHAVEWEYVVTNTSNIPLTGITITDDNGTPLDSSDDYHCMIPGHGELGPGNSSTCNQTDFASVGQYLNTAVASVSVNDQVFSDSDVAHYFGYTTGQLIGVSVTINGKPAGTQPGVYVHTSIPADILYTVSNLSPGILQDVEIMDTNNTPADASDDISICTIESINPGGSETCSRQWTINQGQNTRSTLVTGTIDTVDVEAANTSYAFGVTPGLTIDKLTNGQDPSSPLALLLPFDNPVSWTYNITNTSNVAVTGIQVTDDKGVQVSCPKSQLTLGESMTCTASGKVQAGTYTNKGSVTGQPPGGINPFSAEATSYYYGITVGITLEVKVNGDPSPVSPGIEIPVDSLALLTYEVTNTSNYQMVDITVTDNAGNEITCPKTILVTDEKMTCAATETVNLGVHTRTAEVNGSVNGQPASTTDTVYFTGKITEYYVYLPLIKR